ncbi:hypothetical protein OEZ86_005035 [Tetradesmus obliquus]|nr:hypothetical protein OEZ86_005035 [Tetradesmus obliquus]
MLAATEQQMQQANPEELHRAQAAQRQIQADQQQQQQQQQQLKADHQQQQVQADQQQQQQQQQADQQQQVQADQQQQQQQQQVQADQLQQQQQQQADQQQQKQQQQQQQQQQQADHYQQQQQQPQQLSTERRSSVAGPATPAPADVATAAAGTHPPLADLDPTSLTIVKPQELELGALPCQQEVQYWQLSGLPFDSGDLHQLVTEYLEQGEQLLPGRSTRRGTAPDSVVQVPAIVQQGYPVLQPTLSSMLVQAKQQQHAGSYQETSDAVVLLFALRCLHMWHTIRKCQPDTPMPMLLQRLTG